MASLPIMTFATPKVKVYATAAKGASSSATKEDKGFIEWVWGKLQKDDQFYETDPILKKVEEEEVKSGGTVGNRRGGGGGGGGEKSSVVDVPEKKKGGFGLGGFFTK